MPLYPKHQPTLNHSISLSNYAMACLQMFENGRNYLMKSDVAAAINQNTFRWLTNVDSRSGRKIRHGRGYIEYVKEKDAFRLTELGKQVLLTWSRTNVVKENQAKLSFAKALQEQYESLSGVRFLDGVEQKEEAQPRKPHKRSLHAVA